MTYNEFRLRFAIQYVGCVSDLGECMRRMDNAPALARLLWDVMNAPEVQAPSAPIVANLTDLKHLARTAREVVSDTAQWLAVDPNGEVWAFDLKPTIDTPRNVWDNSDDAGFSWEISAVAPPADFTKELYEIDKLLSNDQL